MNDLSDAAKRLVRRLSGALVRRGGLPVGRTEDQVGQVTRLGDSGQLSALWTTMRLLSPGETETAQAAALATHKVIASQAHENFDRLVHELGNILDYYGYDYTKDIARLKLFGEASVSLMCVASLHYNGYVREDAVKNMPESTDGIEVPFLLLRLNDWVEPVREAAEKQLEQRLVPAYADIFLRDIKMVTALLGRSRADHRQFVYAVRSLLQRPELRGHLLRGLDSEDKRTRRLCFEIAVDAEGADVGAIMDRALHDSDPIIRLWALRHAMGRLPDDLRCAALDQALQDSFVPVRREAIYAYGKEPSTVFEPVMMGALLDANRSVREAARYYLGHHHTDFRAFYRGAVEAGGLLLCPAVEGLSEVGQCADADLVLPLVRHPRAKVAKTAIAAVDRLCPDQFSELHLEILADERPGVSREARRVLLRRKRWISGDDVWNVFTSVGLPHVRKNALAVLSELGKWRSLPYLVRACGSDDTSSADLARSLLRRWRVKSQSSFLEPSPEQLRQILAALEECEPVIGAELSSQIRWVLKPYLSA